MKDSLREAKIVPLVDAELVMAGDALKLATRRDVIRLGAATTRAHGLAVRLRPAQLAERAIGGILAHAEHGLEAESASLGGEKKVLHVIVSSAYTLHMMISRILVNDECTLYDDIQHQERTCRSVEKEWESKVKLLLKGELARRGVTYAQLVGKLADIGVMDTEPNIRNKISRGKFTAVFLIQCLTAIGVSELRLG